MKLFEQSASQAVLGNQQAFNLPPIPGRAIYQYSEPIELQIPHIKGDDGVKKLIKDSKRESKPRKGGIEIL